MRRRRDGTMVNVSLSISPLKDAAGKIVGASKIARDITAERNATIAQNELVERLQQALAEIKTLRGASESQAISQSVVVNDPNAKEITLEQESAQLQSDDIWLARKMAANNA